MSLSLGTSTSTGEQLSDTVYLTVQSNAHRLRHSGLEDSIDQKGILSAPTHVFITSDAHSATNRHILEKIRLITLLQARLNKSRLPCPLLVVVLFSKGIQSSVCQFSTGTA